MRKLLFAAGLAVVLSCQKKVEAPPIADEKMVRIVADLYSVEAVLTLGTPKQRDSLAPLFQSQVFESQGVTKADYEKSIDILTHEPIRLDTILARASRLLDGKSKDTRPIDSRPQ